ncbi:hypothetical protein W02_42190 [Nitrospira sp. KM1]|uniref:hypothetical protein n=1 Tax=Nitrospira sp. KM1 TaxID=1936990 RepID=UPI0013A74747|nr:hypothetical protein [Nitrospira sp. KM1]BCA57079.1 hypothetical protein W02_42190 [Nitrospira sp. KM1]
MRNASHGNSRRLTPFLLAMFLMVLITMTERSVDAAIVTTGEVNPADPSAWAGGTTVTIANTANGSVTVNGGSSISTGTVEVAKTFGVTGALTVDGLGSTWNTGSSISVGTSSLPANFAGGTGIVNISNGGTINGTVFIGQAFNTTGYLNITTGGRLTRGGSLGDLLNSNGIVTVDGVGSQWASTSGSITVAQRGNGLLKILNGATVSSSGAGVGRYTTGTGRVILDGPGSSWTMGIGGLQVGTGMAGGPGPGGVGLVTVTNGATMTNQGEAILGYTLPATGTVMVNGTGSTFTSAFDLYIGRDGAGRVSITDGAKFQGGPVNINSQSLLTVDVGTGSSVVSTAPFVLPQLNNNGTIRTVAKATAANGTYTPIVTSGAWDGTGKVQAVGGVWNNATHTMTVSTAATGQAGIATTIDRSVTQRILITDGATGKQVGASFQAAIAPANLSLTASLMNNGQLSLLQGLLDPGKAILSGWDFSATGYTAGDPVYLSLQIGADQKFYDLDVWHYDGTSWAKYLNTDLAYDNTFASFVATGFSGYAISGLAPVPVPAAMWLFGSGMVTVIGLARRRMSFAKA